MTDNKKLTKNEKREAARAKAAAILIENDKRHKRRIITFWLTGITTVLAIGGLIATIILTGQASTMAASLTAPNNMATNGVIMTSDTNTIKNTGYDLEQGTPADADALIKEAGLDFKPNITIYLDYACPHCKEFEQKNSAYLDTLLQSGKVTVEYKPIIVIGSSLSFDGGNTAACVANFAPDKFLKLNNSLFTLTDSGGNDRSIRPLIDDLNLDQDTKTKVLSCMSGNVFGKWLEKATDTALAAKNDSGGALVTGTPTILIDGVKYPYSPENFPAFMEQVLKGDSPQDVIDQTTN